METAEGASKAAKELGEKYTAKCKHADELAKALEGLMAMPDLAGYEPTGNQAEVCEEAWALARAALSAYREGKA